MTEIEAKYDAFYKARDSAHVYPVEFVVRAFLGSYPRLSADITLYLGRSSAATTTKSPQA